MTLYCGEFTEAASILIQERPSFVEHREKFSQSYQDAIEHLVDGFGIAALAIKSGQRILDVDSSSEAILKSFVTRRDIEAVRIQGNITYIVVSRNQQAGPPAFWLESAGLRTDPNLTVIASASFGYA